MPLVIFDLDGTLVDSRLDLAHSTNEVLESYGAAPLPVDAIAAMVGEGARRLVQRAREAAGLRVPLEEALARFRAVYDRRLLEHTQPYAGIAQGVRAAGALARLAVLTNKPEAPTRRLLEAFALLESFDWVLGGDSGFPRKPNPSGVLHLMAQAGASAADTLFVGDSMIDVETARRAGVPVCVARYGFGHLRGELELRGDELIASEPTDLAQIVARFAAGANERA